MHKEIRWNIDGQFSEEIVKNLEDLWSIKFPKMYVDIVTKHDGAQSDVKNNDGEWRQSKIHISKWHGKFTGFAFLRFTNNEVIEKTRIVSTYNAFKECLPEPDKIFPFALDGAGNVFFFDYRKNANEPAIAFLDHERAVTEEDLADEDLNKKPIGEWLNDNLYHVCNSFSELLDLIEPIND